MTASFTLNLAIALNYRQKKGGQMTALTQIIRADGLHSEHPRDQNTCAQSQKE